MNSRNSAQARLAVRMVAACGGAYVFGSLLGLDQIQWAVLTAIIVMQASVGGSLKAMLDRFIGSLGGAFAGVVVSVGLHQAGLSSPALALAIGLPPLTFLAATRPNYRVTPITFIILILTPNLQELGPILSAYERMLEIVVGSVVALGVSLIVLPARAHDTLAQAVSEVLRAMADLISGLPAGMDGGVDPKAIDAAHAKIRSGIGKAEAAAEEAVRERAVHLTDAPDPLPICRTLRRLRHDIAILGRILTSTFPEPVNAAMKDPVVALFTEIAEFLGGTAGSFSSRTPPPRIDDLTPAFTARSRAASAVRQQGLTRTLPDDDLARIFGLGFALEQLHLDLQDLAARATEFADR